MSPSDVAGAPSRSAITCFVLNSCISNVLPCIAVVWLSSFFCLILWYGIGTRVHERGRGSDDRRPRLEQRANVLPRQGTYRNHRRERTRGTTYFLARLWCTLLLSKLPMSGGAKEISIGKTLPKQQKCCENQYRRGISSGGDRHSYSTALRPLQ